MVRYFFVVVVIALTACRAAPKAPRQSLPVQLLPENAATPGTLTVRVLHIPSVEGVLYVELYDQATYFEYEKVLNEQIVPVTDTTMSITLEHVPAGRYIIAGSHDPNDNHELDTGAFGVPTEAYGFSRDARGVFGPPDFAAGAFDFDGTSAVLELTLR